LSGKSEQQASITKTGTAQARQILVEAAWYCRHHPGLGVNLHRRSQGLPPAMLAVWQVQVRLCGCFDRLTTRGKRSSAADSGLSIAESVDVTGDLGG